MALISGLFLMKILGAVLFIFIGVYLYFKHVVYNYWKKRGVTYVEPTFPTGNVGGIAASKFSIGELFANSYEELKHNRYFGLYAFHKPNLVITDLDLVKDILVRGFGSFHDRGLYCNEEVDPLTGNLFFLPGERWRNLRIKMSPTFTSGKIKQMFGIITECGDKLARHLKPKAENHEVVEMKDLFARYGTDLIMKTAFGIDCNSLEEPDNEYRRYGAKFFISKPLRNMLVTFGHQIMRLFSMKAIDDDVTNFFIGSFKQSVEYRRKNNISRPDFVNLLMQMMKDGRVEIDETNSSPSISETSDGKMTMTEAAAQAFIFFIGGFETTGSTLSACIYELAKHPDIQDKVRADIDDTLKKHGGVTYESLKDMAYLRKVVSETLRLHSPFPMLNRQATYDIELPTTNLRLEKGLDIVIPISGIHMDPEIYPNPKKFDPERFNEENTAARHPFAYLPFGEGPRNCIGKRFAYVNVYIALVSVLTKYRVTVAPNTPQAFKLDPGNFITTSLNGIPVRIEPR